MPDTLTITTVIIAVVSGEIRSFTSKKGFDMRPVIAGFLLGIFLYLIGEVSPALSKAFSVLIIITALVVNGDGIATALQLPKGK